MPASASAGLPLQKPLLFEIRRIAPHHLVKHIGHLPVGRGTTLMMIRGFPVVRAVGLRVLPKSNLT
jgi:hypothetical protein